MKISRYAKTIVAVLVAAVYALQAAITDGTVTPEEWIGIALAALTALGVYAVPNDTTPTSRPQPGNTPR